MNVIVVALIALIIIVPLFWIIGAYNGLIRLRNRVRNAWSQIDVQLKRRHDLIPNLVETAKGYMKHEKETLENVVKARNMAINANGVAKTAEAEGMLTETLKSLFAVVENYPDLKANQNMMQVQEELTSTENRIAFARQHYNDSAMTYNTAIEVFPKNIIAGMFNFSQQDFFEAPVTEREAPKVQF
jgi:LemA protein